tara:strand:- start:406 stop:630 length:225 start_codon:yes stop_codon:yes gene_type:complete
MARPTKKIKAKVADKYWIDVGAIWENEKGVSISLNTWFNPSALARTEVDDRGNTVLAKEVWLSVFDAEENNDNF